MAVNASEMALGVNLELSTVAIALSSTLSSSWAGNFNKMANFLIDSSETCLLKGERERETIRRSGRTRT